MKPSSRWSATKPHRLLEPRRRHGTTTVAPTTIQPIIRNNRDTNERELVSLRWGLVPFFTKDIKQVKGISTINARAETVATSRTYSEPFKKRRCLVLMVAQCRLHAYIVVHAFSISSGFRCGIAQFRCRFSR